MELITHLTALLALMISTASVVSYWLTRKLVLDTERALKAKEKEFQELLENISKVHNSLMESTQDVQTRLTGIEMVVKGKIK